VEGLKRATTARPTARAIRGWITEDRFAAAGSLSFEKQDPQRQPSFEAGIPPCEGEP
jgi:hypothetical protein